MKKKRKEHLKFYPNDGIRRRLGPSGPFAVFRGIAVGVAVAAVGVDGVVVERWWRGVRGGGIDEGGGVVVVQARRVRVSVQTCVNI